MVIHQDAADVLSCFLLNRQALHLFSKHQQVFAKHLVSLLSYLQFPLPVLIGYKFPKKILQGFLATFSYVGQIYPVFFSLFQHIALLFEVFVHSFVFFCSVDSSDGCKSAGQSIENKNIFDVDKA